MANMYAAGIGTPRNDENAFICYEIAAEAGDPQAKYMLGQWLCEGRGTKKDVQRGMSLLVGGGGGERGIMRVCMCVCMYQDVKV